MATTTAEPAGPPGKPGLLGSLKRKPGLAVAVVGGGGLAVLLLLKKGSANSAADTGASSTAAPGTIDPSVYGTPSDLAGQQDYLGNTDASAIEAQLTTLQGQIAQIATNTMPHTPAPKPKPKPKPRGFPPRKLKPPIRRGVR